MAKISVSLPDPLKEQLDDYAQIHGHSVSQTVQLALEAFLSQSPPPPPPGGQLELLEKLVREVSGELEAVRSDLTHTQRALDRHRDCFLQLKPLTDLAGVVLTLPPELLP